MKTRSIGSCWFLLVFAVLCVEAKDDFDAAAVFNNRCGVCHTVGRGDDVGPDLQGVTERRDEAWLIAFVQSSQTVIGAGDPTAVELFERYGRQKMPDHPYTAQQISEIFAYVEAGGPSTVPPTRFAANATPEDVRAGRDLFFSRSAEEASCASCHTLSASPRLASLYLGGSLTHAFSKYRDVELARRLTRGRKLCRRELEDHESFVVRAFLRHVDSNGGEAGGGGMAWLPWFGWVPAALLLGLLGRAFPSVSTVKSGEAQ